MKKVILFLIFSFPFFGISQEIEKHKSSIDSKKHEIKFGGIKLLAGPILELTYEYVPSKDFSYGTSVLVNFSKDNGFNENFSITPFGRFYFQESKEYGAQGFFVEGFLKVSNGNYQQDNFFNNQKTSYTSGGYGLSIGKKWVNNSGFIFEILAGGARGLGDGKTAPNAYFRGDFNIGYRFN